MSSVEPSMREQTYTLTRARYAAQRLHTYPDYIQYYTGIPTYNLGIGGAANSTILQQVFSVVGSIENTDDILVIVLLSTKERLSMTIEHDDGKLHDATIFPSHDSGWEQNDRNRKDLAKFYREHIIGSPIHGASDENTCVDFLKANNIKHIVMYAFDDPHDRYTTLNLLSAQYKDGVTLERDTNDQNYESFYDESRYLHDFHPSAMGHKVIAKYLIEKAGINEHNPLPPTKI